MTGLSTIPPDHNIEEKIFVTKMNEINDEYPNNVKPIEGKYPNCN